jgi:hypothetical protein
MLAVATESPVGQLPHSVGSDAIQKLKTRLNTATATGAPKLAMKNHPL